MKFGVIVFPGSNCDTDCYHLVQNVLGQEAYYIWHQQGHIDGCDALILPGGFSYGDYLRTGAIARFSPIMPAVIDFAHQGGLVIGICNGFQILLEAGLLPGAMLRNRNLRFICGRARLKVQRTDTAFTNQLLTDEIIKVPIAHGQGNYFCDPPTLAALKKDNRILFSYCDANGMESQAANPNGSAANIAGIMNEGGNVLGMMPHPERCGEEILGGTDGLRIFASMMEAFQGGKRG